MNPLIFQKNTREILYIVFCSKPLIGLMDTKLRDSIDRIQNKKRFLNKERWRQKDNQEFYVQTLGFVPGILAI